jgi:hypothetical protein
MIVISLRAAVPTEEMQWRSTLASAFGKRDGKDEMKDDQRSKIVSVDTLDGPEFGLVICPCK